MYILKKADDISPEFLEFPADQEVLAHLGDPEGQKKDKQ